MKDFSMYRYFKGETENPFESTSIANHFWFYESIFERDYNERESSDWFSFFSDYGMGDDFMNIFSAKPISSDDYKRPTNKKAVFELWLEYLFSEKLSKEEKELYHNTKVVI